MDSWGANSTPIDGAGSAVPMSTDEPVEKRARGAGVSGSPMAADDGIIPVPDSVDDTGATSGTDDTREGTRVDGQGAASATMRDRGPGEPADADSTGGGDDAGGDQMTESADSDTDSSSTQEQTVGRADRNQAPVVKLSIKLIDTYNHINQVYYKKQKEKKHNQWDNKNCDYIVKDGDLINNERYRLQKVIGSGSFGQVVKAVDTHRDVEVAIKIIKNKPAFHKQAKMEVELLEELNMVDPASIGNRDPNIVQLLAHFVHKEHMCLVFELLSYNLYDLLRLTKFRGVSLNLIRKFGKQIITSLLVLAQQNIIHCDLKPENILLRHPKRSAIKVIDFGSSCRDSKTVYTYIQSRYYRAPEVILGAKYAVAIDMWSLGCTLVEMHTGEPLFGGQDEGDQLKKIVEMLGPLPTSLTDRASAKKRDKGLIPVSVKKMKDLRGVVADAKQRNRDKEDHTDDDYAMFLDLIHKMLAYEPAERITPVLALAHPFLQGHSPRYQAPPAAAAVGVQVSSGPPPVPAPVQAWGAMPSSVTAQTAGLAPATDMAHTSPPMVRSGSGAGSASEAMVPPAVASPS